MTRQRIRSLKPECWADEKIGGLSRDADTDESWQPERQAA